MRILHTSDWHLGQHFMGKSRQAEHQALIAWLLEQVAEHQVDAVLIAGDISTPAPHPPTPASFTTNWSCACTKPALHCCCSAATTIRRRPWVKAANRWRA